MADVTRRSFLTAALAASALPAFAQQTPVTGTPTPRDWSGQTPLRYPDPDLVALDPRFRRYIVNAPIERLHIGTYWAEGPAWNGVGRYLIWSDIPRNVQLRWLEDDGEVTVARNPSGFSNGNTFDYQGRQLSAEHGGRRVARYEYDGSVTTIAERYDNKRLNSPNDVIVHPDGGIWFTDPIYGIRGDFEGNAAESEIAPAIYRVDPRSAQITKLTDQVRQPNGLCFSPDYTKLYVADTGTLDLRVFDIDGVTVKNGRQLAQLTVPGGGRSYADGIRCDVDGNIWCGANPGVQVVAPDGTAIGVIRLPEVCANVCFGGARRTRLFMTASQSLYSVVVNVRGAHIA